MVLRGNKSLEAKNWVRVSFEVLRDDGVGGVKITEIAKILDLKTGNFYWHSATCWACWMRCWTIGGYFTRNAS